MKKLRHYLNQLKQYLLTMPIVAYSCLVLFIGAVARYLYIAKASIWHDEGYTMMLINFSPLEIIARTARDVHPPLYYLFTHFWQQIFGSSELAIRSVSVLFGLGIIVLVYFIVRRLFSEGTARLSMLFVALGPFLVRYSDEARMYMMAAFFVTLASLLFLKAIQDKNHQTRSWILYGLTLTAALYTHYYAIFIVPAHLIYLILQKKSLRKILKDRNWWLGHLIPLALFSAWLPTVYAQTTRVQSGFWIPPVSAETVPNTFMQFLAFMPSYNYSGWVGGALLVVFIYSLVAVFMKLKSKRNQLWFSTLWLALPLLLVILISLKQPVYYDRYFTFCAVAFYILLAAIVTYHPRMKSVLAQSSLVVILLLVSIVGIDSVRIQASHQMKVVGNYVSQNYQPGDEIISGELYTYFDFSYYNQTDTQLRLLTDSPLSGYGESSLIYDQQPEITAHSLDEISSSRAWIVGKTGDKDYFGSKIPANWSMIDEIQAGESVARLYITNAE